MSKFPSVPSQKRQEKILKFGVFLEWGITWRSFLLVRVQCTGAVSLRCQSLCLIIRTIGHQTTWHIKFSFISSYIIYKTLKAFYKVLQICIFPDNRSLVPLWAWAGVSETVDPRHWLILELEKALFSDWVPHLSGICGVDYWRMDPKQQICLWLEMIKVSWWEEGM